MYTLNDDPTSFIHFQYYLIVEIKYHPFFPGGFPHEILPKQHSLQKLLPN